MLKWQKNVVIDDELYKFSHVSSSSPDFDDEQLYSLLDDTNSDSNYEPDIGDECDLSSNIVPPAPHNKPRSCFIIPSSPETGERETNKVNLLILQKICQYHLQ